MLELNPPSLQLAAAGKRISLDSPGELVFVSHAHSDHAPRSKNKGVESVFITSKATVDLLAAKGRSIAKSVEHLPADGLKIRLLDSGHILGSKQFYAEWDGDAGSGHTSFLYSGDFKLDESLTAPRAETAHAEKLLLETTYGIPEYSFPARDQTYEDIAHWVKSEHHAGHNVLLGGYAIGKAQELVAVLNNFLGIIPIVTKPVFDACEVYRRHGVKLDFVCAESEDGKEMLELGGFAAVVPMHLASAEMASQLSMAYGRKTVAAVATGWALHNWFRGARAFCLSDHADHAQLLEYVDLVRPKKVFTTHGFAREFAEELKKRGVDAVALEDALAKTPAGAGAEVRARQQKL
jgi:Cft2 family RNA processing exonuclease